MNYSMDRRIIGVILWIECAILAIPTLIATVRCETSLSAFLATLALTFITGAILAIPKVKDKRVQVRDALFVTAMTWISMSAFGALPLFLSGSVPTYIDAYFEIMSGFTTTGATIISDVESLDYSINFLRCFSHWIGGMGIMIFTIAVIPAGGSTAFQIFKAESPGPEPGRLVPKIKDTAIFTYKIYAALTLILVIFLKLGGMNLFDSFLHAFSTLGTGGFSNKNNGIIFYKNPLLEYILSIFMILAASNFSLYYLLLKKNFDDILRDDEFKLYLRVILIVSGLISLNLFFKKYASPEQCFRTSLFQVTSLMSTTGFSSADFDLFPTFSKWLLMLVMFFGGSAGSTAGGIKITRIFTAFQIAFREITFTFHSNAMQPLMKNGKAEKKESVRGTIAFLLMYFLIFAVGVFLISLENLNFETTFSSVLCTLSNVGPGFGLVGPTHNFAFFSPFSKIIFSILMLLGRLEIYTVIALLAPNKYRKQIKSQREVIL